MTASSETSAQPGTIVYAALYNSCTYESADGALSLHATRAGAEAALEAHREHLLREKRLADLPEHLESWEVLRVAEWPVLA